MWEGGRRTSGRGAGWVTSGAGDGRGGPGARSSGAGAISEGRVGGGAMSAGDLRAAAGQLPRSLLRLLRVIEDDLRHPVARGCERAPEVADGQVLFELGANERDVHGSPSVLLDGPAPACNISEFRFLPSYPIHANGRRQGAPAR